MIYDIGRVAEVATPRMMDDLHPCRSLQRAASLRVLFDLRSGKITLLQEQAVRGWALPGGVVAFVRQDGGGRCSPDSHGGKSGSRSRGLPCP